jgi:malate dehydrogenase
MAAMAATCFHAATAPNAVAFPTAAASSPSRTPTVSLSLSSRAAFANGFTLSSSLRARFVSNGVYGAGRGSLLRVVRADAAGASKSAPKSGPSTFKVAVLGAAGGIGQPLSLLVKMSPLVSELRLYDIANVKGVAADLSHCNTPAQVTVVFCGTICR